MCDLLIASESSFSMDDDSVTQRSESDEMKEMMKKTIKDKKGYFP